MVYQTITVFRYLWIYIYEWCKNLSIYNLPEAIPSVTIQIGDKIF